MNQNGLVTAVGQGTATITVSRGDKTASCEVVVSAPLESISIQPTLELLKKQTAALTITYNPENTTDDKTAVWSSSDDKIATVDQNGVVTAVAPGKATITAKVGKHEAACTVTVKEQPLNSIALNKQEMTLDKGKTESLTVTYNPEDTTDDKTVVWSTSDSNVATVKNGVVTAVGVGKDVYKRQAQVGTGDRSERIRTYNYPQGRITDHRIGLTLYHLEQNMNGDIDEIIDALITADQAAKLAAESED